MRSIPIAGPAGPSSILVLAKDTGDRWLVQEGLGRMRRRFASLDAAINFASHGQHPFRGAAIAISCRPTPPEPRAEELLATF